MPKKWLIAPTEDEQVPVGFGTYLGLAGTLTAFSLALIAFISGDRSEETIGALVTGGLILYGVIQSRGKQAAAKIEAKGRKVG